MLQIGHKGVTASPSYLLLGILGLVLFVFSIIATGTPYLAAGVSIACPILVWACLRPKRLIYLLVVYSCIYPFLISDLGLPRLLSYGGDLINLVALVFAIRQGGFKKVDFGFFRFVFMAFCLVALFSAMLHGVSLLLVVWEARNVLRFFAFFYSVAVLLDESDRPRLIKMLFVIFIVNVLLCSWESLVLHYGQDNTNGLFGSGSGGNASTNILLLEMSCLALFAYGGNKAGLGVLLFIICCSCWVSIIAELKVYFVQLILLLVMFLLIKKPSFKTVFLVVLFFLVIWCGLQLFVLFRPDWSGFFDLQAMLESSSVGGYGNADGLNRLSALDTLDSMFFDNWPDRLFGLGFGAGTYSQFFSAPLYAVYGETLHWTWFTDAQIFLETGYTGLILYVLMFLVLGMHYLHLAKEDPSRSRVFQESSFAMSLFCILLIVYNCVLTVDPGGYLVFLFLALPLVGDESCSRQCSERYLSAVKS